MYWYNKTALHRGFVITAFALAGLMPACKPDVKETGAAMVYFDLKGYFKTNALKLGAKNKPVLKTVMHNGSAESKQVTIENWEHELSLFSGSDINKPAWKDSYYVQNSANATIYTAKYPELETRYIIINKAGNQVKWILIFNHTKNLLYENKEKLTWLPDSMYRIEKLQHVRLMGTNRYDIKGIF